jgi:hypothetical protein
MKAKINVVDEHGKILKEITRKIHHIHGVSYVLYNDVYHTLRECPEKPIEGTKGISRYYIYE